MNTARLVVLTIAVGAGGLAAYLASGSDNKPQQAAPVAQMQTVDVLVAKADIPLGKTLTASDLQWQSWPAAAASASFVRRDSRPDATKQLDGTAIARSPFVTGKPTRDSKLVVGGGAGFMAEAQAMLVVQPVSVESCDLIADESVGLADAVIVSATVGG